MRAIVLGAGGMLGHKLLQHLSTSCAAAGTIRGTQAAPKLQLMLSGAKLYCGVDARDLQSVSNAIDDWRANVVINCIGIVKQIEAAKDPIDSISINSLFPHYLGRLAAARNAKLIHFSTDCVFSGTRGNYTEDDNPDPVDLYGRTKLLGEMNYPPTLTVRTSIIGHELRGHHGLIDWFLSQRNGRVSGFANARYSGLTTLVLSNLLVELLKSEPEMYGLWQISGEPISKYHLLQIVNEIYGLGVDLARDESFVCDRTLNCARFRSRTGWKAPQWEEMITAMHAEVFSYA